MREADYHYRHQLQMDYAPVDRTTPPTADTPAGYSVRQFRFGDEAAYYDLMHAVGWTQWDQALFEQWIGRVLPQSWFVVSHDATQQLVASAFCAHSHTPHHPFGGELGWVAAHPAHRGQGLGRLVVALTTARFIAMGYQHIHLYTEDFRLAAIHIYLRMGYRPFLDLPEMHGRWQAVCAALQWPFAPDRWRSL